MSQALTDREAVPSTVREAPRAGRAPLVWCFALLLGIKTSLLALGFGRTYRLLVGATRDRGARVDGCSALVNAIAERVATAAAFFPGRALCLEQSLTLFVLLRRRGIQAELRLGVQPYPFAAHAWVEHAGRAVGEPPEMLQAYVPFSSLPERWR